MGYPRKRAVPTPRNALWIGCLAAFALLSSNDRLWRRVEGVGAVPLTKDLPGITVEAQKMFDNRIKARFPVGSSVAGMLSELNKEGFVQGRNTVPDDEHFATRQDGATGVCVFQATAYWRSDSSNRVKTISGSYDATCL